MSVVKKILSQPLDPDLREDLAKALAGPQEQMTRDVSRCLTTMEALNVGHVVLLVNARTGVVTFASNLERDFAVQVLRDIAVAVEKGES